MIVHVLDLEGAGDSVYPPEHVGGKAAGEAAGRLYELALRYWADGREEDAARVALEAQRLLATVDPSSELMGLITSTITSIRDGSSGRATTRG